ADPFGHLSQPAYDLGGVLRQRVAREGGREVLLQEQRRLAPRLGEPPRRVPVLALAERLGEPRQMILHARDDEHPRGAREAGRGVVLELGRVERELPRGLADRVWEIDAEVAGREIDAVRLAHVRRKIARQLALEALEVALQSLPRPTGRTGRARTGDRGPC